MKIVLIFLAEKIVAVKTIVDRQLGKDKKIGDQMIVGGINATYIHSEHSGRETFLLLMAEDNFAEVENHLQHTGWRPVAKHQSAEILSVFPPPAA